MKKSSMTSTAQEALIKKEIERLHKRNNSDFQSLLRQVEKRRKVVYLNVPQAVAMLSRAKNNYWEWGRGTGKTTGLGAHFGGIVQEMSRSSGLFIGATYQLILTRIVPSLVQGLERFGFYKDLHYFIGKQPPRSWRRYWGKAYQPPERYDRYITFWNGTGVHLISHDVKGDGRALNTDWIVGDEAALLDPSKLQENTDPTLRGTQVKEFENSRFFGSKLYTSSTPLTPEGMWFIKNEELSIQEPDKHCFISATAAHNKHNLRKGYMEEAKANAYAEWVYLAEYENVRPKFTKDGFYPLLDKDIHCYNDYDYSFYHKIGQTKDCRGDRDLTKGQPLILGIDWGGAINCLTVNQHLLSINEYRTLNSMFVLGTDQKIQDDLFQDFHNYYRHHDCKELILYYDNTGNVQTGITKRTRAEQAQAQLIQLGWKPRLMTVGGRNISHETKFHIWETLLAGNHPRLPRYRMNKGNCAELYISMKHAQAKPKRNGGIEKDKGSERSQKIQRQYATDLSDANDTPVIGQFAHLVKGFGAALPATRTSRR